MNIFDFSPIKKLLNNNSSISHDIKKLNTEEEQEITPLKNWIWVKGYKGFSKKYIDGNAVLMARNDFIYKENEITSVPEKDIDRIETGRYGLHFSQTLKDVFSYYNPFLAPDYDYSITDSPISCYETVFAEVEAEVNAEYYEENKDNKNTIAAKSIKITRIIPDEEIAKAIKNLDISFSIEYENYFVEPKDFLEFKNELNKICLKYKGYNRLSEVENLAENYRRKYNYIKATELIEKGYSESFAHLVVDRGVYKEALIYADEGISLDMRAYLLFGKFGRR